MSEKLGYSAQELWGNLPAREPLNFLGQDLPFTYHIYAQFLKCCAEDLEPGTVIGSCDGLSIPHPKFGIVDGEPREVIWNGTGCEDRKPRR